MFHTSDGRKVIENLDEFDDAREVVAGLAAEYQACERPDYVSLASMPQNLTLLVKCCLCCKVCKEHQMLSVGSVELLFLLVCWDIVQ